MPEQLTSIQEFLFGAPLYAEYNFEATARELLFDPLVVDGHCVECGKTSTFSRERAVEYLDLESIQRRAPWIVFDFRCARNAKHEIIFAFRTNASVIMKIGQYPSLADIANDESRTYRSVLDETDGAELHRVIGLAAHGVGVGSFVYLRRILERLIAGRFHSFKQQEGWQCSSWRTHAQGV